MFGFTNHWSVLVAFVLMMCCCVSKDIGKDTIDPKEIPVGEMAYVPEGANEFTNWQIVKSTTTKTSGDQNVIAFVDKLQSLRSGMSVGYAERLLGVKPLKIVRDEDLGLGPGWESRIYFRMFKGEAVIGDHLVYAVAFYLLVWSGKGGNWTAYIGES